MKNEPDYFDYEADDQPVFFNDNSTKTGKDERHLEVYVEKDCRPLTATDATHAIAGILQLWQHPDADLHGYTQFLNRAGELVKQMQIDQIADEIIAESKAAGMAKQMADDARANGTPAAVEAKGPRSLEEILGQ